MTEAPQFEQALEDLEAILRDLENDATSLDAALTKYERGVTLLKQCYGQLHAAEQKIKQLTGVDADGTPTLATFEHTAAVTKAKRTRGDG